MPLEKPDAAGPNGRNLADVLAACSREELLRYVHTLERRALHDPLTGLANRALLSDRLQQAVALSRRYGSPFALLVCDLDGFKEVNDRHGHEVGDRVLCAVSERLTGIIRASDSVARIGGDEFAILLPDTDRAGTKVVIEKIAAAMKEPVRVEGLSLQVGASVGVSMFPDDAADVAALVRRADRQMYGVKGRRRAPLRRFARGLALGAVMWIWAAVVGAVLLDSLGGAGRLPDLAETPRMSAPATEPSAPEGGEPLRILASGRSFGLGGGGEVQEVSLAGSRASGDRDADGGSTPGGGGGGGDGGGKTGGGGGDTGGGGGDTGGGGGGGSGDGGSGGSGGSGSDDGGSSDDGPGRSQSRGNGGDKDDDGGNGGGGKGKGRDKD